ncbi:helix-turn-helix domain-containing protein [Streptomyces sp. NPDC007025]|uniref:helix-turn-helix domain-containing protein n=1 Tax=Streptomyces sp. NPDC007025 TaxID=3364771 RepID=UPI0036C0C957
MALPDWQDPEFGSMIRAALWLETEVEEGGIFTKTALRSAFADVAQIDRRIRDLRARGWQIDTRREDPTLKLDEQRYVKKGAEVWVPGQAAAAKSKASLTATQRSAVLRQDNYLCRSCGVGSGEAYGDEGVRAQLDIARREVRLLDGTVKTELVTECNRCRIGGRSRQEDLGALLTEVKALSGTEKSALAGWISEDRRMPSALERLWGQYRALPEESRAVLAAAVIDDVTPEG